MYTYYSDEFWINKNASNAFVFNESKFDPVYWNPTQSRAEVGTIDGGSLADVQHSDASYDGVTFNFSEGNLSEITSPSLFVNAQISCLICFPCSASYRAVPLPIDDNKNPTPTQSQVSPPI